MLTRLRTYPSVIIGAIVLGTAVALWAMPEKDSPAPVSRPGYLVELAEVQAASSRRTVRYSGVTRAEKRAVLSFVASARLLARNVEEGSHVTAGQVLARLDDQGYRNGLNQARARVVELQARLDQAVRDHVRVEQLAASKTSTRERLEQAAAEVATLGASVRAARAALEEAERLVEETVLRAPFSGTVTALHLEPNEWAAAGRPILELVGDGPVELMVEVPESFVNRLELQQSVTVLLPFVGNRKVEGRIRSIALASMGEGRLFPVKVQLARQSGVLPGLTAQLFLDLANQDELSVPLAAVLNPGSSRPYLFVYREGRVHRQEVRLGPLADGKVIVRGGLSMGDRVVVNGQSQLSDGDAVEVGS